MPMASTATTPGRLRCRPEPGQGRQAASSLAQGSSSPSAVVSDCAASTARTVARATASAAMADRRSEEHTSELQSPCNLVCRLLLEKKKKKIITQDRLTKVNLYPTEVTGLITI